MRFMLGFLFGMGVSAGVVIGGKIVYDIAIDAIKNPAPYSYNRPAYYSNYTRYGEKKKEA